MGRFAWIRQAFEAVAPMQRSSAIAAVHLRCIRVSDRGPRTFGKPPTPPRATACRARRRRADALATATTQADDRRLARRAPAHAPFRALRARPGRPWGRSRAGPARSHARAPTDTTGCDARLALAPGTHRGPGTGHTGAPVCTRASWCSSWPVPSHLPVQPGVVSVVVHVAIADARLSRLVGRVAQAPVGEALLAVCELLGGLGDIRG
jgi:hypothetical protein